MQIPKPTDADRERFQSLVPDEADVQTKSMFGNLGAFVHGHLFMGLSGRDIGIKLDEPDHAAARPQTRRRTLRASRTPNGRLRHAPRRLDGPQGEAVDRQGLRRRRRAATQAGKEEGSQEVTVDVTTEIIIDRPRDVVARTPPIQRTRRSGTTTSTRSNGRPNPRWPSGSRAAFVARLPRPPARVHLRAGGRSARRADRHAHRTGSVPDGDHLHLDGGGRHGNADALRNHGEPTGFSKVVAPLMATGDAARQPQGPRPPQEDPRGGLMDSIVLRRGVWRGQQLLTTSVRSWPVMSGDRRWPGSCLRDANTTRS